MSTTQDYTITAAAPTQPSSGSYEVALLDPVVTITGIEADEAVVLRISQDGSDPASTDRAIVVTRKDAQGGTWKEKVTVKAGNKMVFLGDRLTASSSITVQVEAS